MVGGSTILYTLVFLFPSGPVEVAAFPDVNIRHALQEPGDSPDVKTRARTRPLLNSFERYHGGDFRALLYPDLYGQRVRWARVSSEKCCNLVSGAPCCEYYGANVSLPTTHSSLVRVMSTL
jgi:hypothetical protein